MAKVSPTVRTLASLRKQGYSAQVVERWNMYGRCRIDLFGFIDVVGIKSGEPGVLGVQTTTQAHAPERFRKILGIPESKIWLEAGNRILIHGWALKGGAGKRKLWSTTEKYVALEDFK